MGFWSRLLGRDTKPEKRHASISFDAWTDFFSFGGTSYPILNTTWGNGTEEQIAATTNAAYKANGPVFALVLARMQVFSQARFQWTRFEGGKAGDLFGSRELRILERPWRGGTTADLLARMELDVSLAGNAYIRRIGNRLVRLRPDWVTIVLGSNEDAEHPADAGDVEVVGYMYKPGGNESSARAVPLLPEQVAHYAPIPDPDFHFLGLSWITTVIKETQADNAMVVHKRKFLENAATPNLAIKFDPSITREAVAEFKELMEAEHKGAWNAYKTLFLGGGADPVPIGKDFRELEFSATQGKGESRLASAAGVPPSWVGFSEGLQGSSLNAGNFTAARRRFGDGTMQHLWSNAASSLEPIVGAPDEGAYLWPAVTDIPFMREGSKDAGEIQAQEAQTITALVRDGFTADSAIAAVQNNDWKLLKHSGLVSVQMQPPGEAAPNGKTPNGKVPATVAT